MKTIQKQISLEPTTSRLPSVWPSYYERIIDDETNEMKIYYFDDESLKEREWQYISNWGMTPLNIVVTPEPSSIDENTDDDLPLNDRKHLYSAYTLVSGCSNCCDCLEDDCTSGCCHCYCGYVTHSGTPIHCFDDSGNTVVCPIDEYGKVKSGYTPYYYDEICDFTLSFDNLSKWYYFFNEYYNLLKQYSHCDRVYTSAEDYYNYESLTKYADQMIYGSDKQTYLDLDEEFANKGGRVEVLIFDKDTSEFKKMTPKEAHDEYKEENTDRMAMVDVYDVGFFKWICENVVPSFIIPKKYRNYWKKDKLFYPDVVKWLAWFGERIGYEKMANFEDGKDKTIKGDIDTWDCKESAITDCCDCEEYFNRGGKRVFSAMSEWYDAEQSAITKNNEIISSNTNCFVPTIILPTNLQVSIDDLGEFSIFSNEYELGVNYRTAYYGDSGNTRIGSEHNSGGTVSTIDKRPMILYSGSGYQFDEVYMEKYVSRCLEENCKYEGVFSEVCPKCGSKNIEVIGWSAYTDYYIDHDYEWDDVFKYNYKNDFYVSAVTYFAYDIDNVKYVSDKNTLEEAEIDLKEKMSKKFPLTIRENGWILIDGSLYPINEIEYALYDKSNVYLRDKKFMVFRMPFTNVPYTYINGKQIFADFYEKERKFYFPFFKNPTAGEEEINCSGKTFNFNDYIHFERNKLNEENLMLYIDYNDNAYEILSSDTQATINDTDYYRISGHTLNDSGETLYYTYDENILSGNRLNVVENAVIDVNEKYFSGNPYVKIEYPFEINTYKVDEINGRTVSKLYDLRLYNVLTDDIGNDIDGIYPIKSKHIFSHQPKQGTELEPLYQVGNTANISRFRITVDDLDDIKKDEDGKKANYFVGDIIKIMKFYYKEYNGNIPEETVVNVILHSGSTYEIKIDGKYINTSVTSGYTSLSAITASTKAKKELEEDEENVHVFYDDIFCDITYYIGATLKRKENENYNLSYDEHICNYGVEYKETVQFIKENREYYLKKPKKLSKIIPMRRNDVSVHSISYPVYVYKLSQKLEHVDNSQYDSSYEVAMADFRFDINIFSANTDTFNQKYSGDMETHNGLQVFPTYREEYRLGNSMIENIDSNIYIDRGINAAFEKHLKLGEVTSLEALEQYGNGFFKFMDNN